MFNNKRIKELEKRIADLEYRLYNLELPYKYEIGDKVNYNSRYCREDNFKAVIVHRSFKYEYNRRVNQYTVFYNGNKSAHVDENDIDKLIK